MCRKTLSGDEIIADLGETDGPEVDLKDWSTDVLKAEKLLETNNDIEFIDHR